ncbi:hypothetical protein PoB_003086600 [Plakobranchus ocellatus]|uniref:Uncharacterized protein n=1 Tax=Plakobranchus ocellatus TaxID=259542 RepID=A0AAV3ZZF4_9GAST|nr:hypothetical protein PoB_003086600 [Plakobranchus ocellatus]
MQSLISRDSLQILTVTGDNQDLMYGWLGLIRTLKETGTGRVMDKRMRFLLVTGKRMNQITMIKIVWLCRLATGNGSMLGVRHINLSCVRFQI